MCGMAKGDDKQAALRLADQAHEVGRASGREPWRKVLRWISGGRLGRCKGRPDVPELGTRHHGRATRAVLAAQRTYV